jgi:hypothetical protein
MCVEPTITFDQYIAGPSNGTNVYGCTATSATNFNPAANIDDDSCVSQFKARVFLEELSGTDSLWANLTSAAQTGATALGWTASTWDSCSARTSCAQPATEDLDWEYLNVYEQAGAVALGWNNYSWDTDYYHLSGGTHAGFVLRFVTSLSDTIEIEAEAITIRQITTIGAKALDSASYTGRRMLQERHVFLVVDFDIEIRTSNSAAQATYFSLVADIMARGVYYIAFHKVLRADIGATSQAPLPGSRAEVRQRDIATAAAAAAAKADADADADAILKEMNQTDSELVTAATVDERAGWGGLPYAPGIGAITDKKKVGSLATAIYQQYHRVIGGVIFKQHIAKDIACHESYGTEKIRGHSDVVYSDFCHPSDTEMLACWDPEFCELVLTDDDRDDVCSSPDQKVGPRCHSVPPESGGSSVIAAEMMYLDLNDTVCQVTEMIDNADKWINSKTLKAELTVVLYNGELGIYSVVDLEFDFTDRGGQVVNEASILTAEVPMRSERWYVLEAAVALFCIQIILGEAGELASSIRNCNLFGGDGYFMDPWNVIDWSVCVIFALQCMFWYHLEFIWYQASFDLLIKPTPVTQDDFMDFITDMTDNAGSAQLVLYMGAVNLILLLLRIIKQCRMHPRLAFVTATLGQASTDLIPFFVVMLLFVFAFSYAAVFIFGQKVAKFASFDGTVLVLFNMLLGDFDAEEMEVDTDHIVNFTWFILFYVIGFYLLLNMLLAIIMDAYAVVKEDSNTEETPSAASDYHTLLLHYFPRSLGCSNRRFYAELADLVSVDEMQKLHRENADKNGRLAIQFVEDGCFKEFEDEDPIREFEASASIDDMDTDEMERQLVRIRSGIATAKLYEEAICRGDMKATTNAQLTEQLDTWWIWSKEHEDDDDVHGEDEPIAPTELLNRVRTSVAGKASENEIPGEQMYTTREVAEVLQVGLSEAAVLFQATRKVCHPDIYLYSTTLFLLFQSTLALACLSAISKHTSTVFDVIACMQIL